MSFTIRTLKFIDLHNFFLSCNKRIKFLILLSLENIHISLKIHKNVKNNILDTMSLTMAMTFNGHGWRANRSWHGPEQCHWPHCCLLVPISPSDIALPPTQESMHSIYSNWKILKYTIWKSNNIWDWKSESYFLNRKNHDLLQLKQEPRQPLLLVQRDASSRATSLWSFAPSYTMMPKPYEPLLLNLKVMKEIWSLGVYASFLKISLLLDNLLWLWKLLLV